MGDNPHYDLNTIELDELIMVVGIYIFDGSSLDGWRAYNGDQMPPGWKIVDSVLTFNTKQILEQD